MSSFTTPLIVTPMPDGRRWKLHRSFEYHVDSRCSNYIIRVPAGFITDFASVPWLFWMVIPSWGKYGKAAVIHDYLYQHHQLHYITEGITITRKEADSIFYGAMLVSGTKSWKAQLMYLAVRWFGFFAWKNIIHAPSGVEE